MDLLGEVVEVLSGNRPEHAATERARGRVRAAIANPNGYLVLWLEILDEADVKPMFPWLPYKLEDRAQVGDLVAVIVGVGHDIVRIVRGGR